MRFKNQSLKKILRSSLRLLPLLLKTATWHLLLRRALLLKPSRRKPRLKLLRRLHRQSLLPIKTVKWKSMMLLERMMGRKTRLKLRLRLR